MWGRAGSAVIGKRGSRAGFLRPSHAHRLAVARKRWVGRVRDAFGARIGFGTCRDDSPVVTAAAAAAAAAGRGRQGIVVVSPVAGHDACKV